MSELNELFSEYNLRMEAREYTDLVIETSCAAYGKIDAPEKLASDMSIQNLIKLKGVGAQSAIQLLMMIGGLLNE